MIIDMVVDIVDHTYVKKRSALFWNWYGIQSFLATHRSWKNEKVVSRHLHALPYYRGSCEMDILEIRMSFSNVRLS